MKHRKSTQFLLFSAMLLMAACGGLEDLAKEDTSMVEMQSLLQFDTKDGGRVEFFETEDGEILSSFLVTPKSEDTVRRSVRGEIDLAETFRILSGKTRLPEDLPALSARLQDIARVKSATKVPALSWDDYEPQNDANSRSSSMEHDSMSRDEFIREQCAANGDAGAGFSFSYCWTNRTGYAKVERRAYLMNTMNYVYRGTTEHRLSYKKGTRIKIYRSHQVPAGYLSSIGLLGSDVGLAWKRTMTAEVRNATGDGYHLSVMGLD
jgi:hypothetical protein